VGGKGESESRGMTPGENPGSRGRLLGKKMKVKKNSSHGKKRNDKKNTAARSDKPGAANANRKKKQGGELEVLAGEGRKKKSGTISGLQTRKSMTRGRQEGKSSGQKTKRKAASKNGGVPTGRSVN